MHDVVFLLDVDNTLVDNDAVSADLSRHLIDAFGVASQKQYWEIFEQLRAELGYADYLGALQRYRTQHPTDPNLLRVSLYLMDYPFEDRLYPGALDVVARLRQRGPTVILTDGDVVFQPLKVHRSGLFEAVEGNVLIYVHKERELEDVERRYPADHYVFVDDKPRLCAAVKASWGERVTTVFPRQGHYAHDTAEVSKYPTPDVTLERIGDFPGYDLPALQAAAIRRP